MDWIDQRSIDRAYRNLDNPHDLYASAMVLLNRRQLQPASEHFGRVCQLMPDSVTAQQWWAYALAAMTRFDEAVKIADEVLSRVEDVNSWNRNSRFAENNLRLQELYGVSDFFGQAYRLVRASRRRGITRSVMSTLKYRSRSA